MEMSEPLHFLIDDERPCTVPALTTPLDILFSEYSKKKSDIERIASYVAGETDVMHFFLDAQMTERRSSSLSAQSLFEVAPALRSLDAHYWSKAMALTDVLEYMPAEHRNAWHQQIRGNETPEFEPASVRSTLIDLLGKRQAFFAERVDGIFRALSGEHVTNSPAAFGKRMIINWVLSVNSGFSYVNYDRVNFIHDLRCVIAKFMGRDEPRSDQTQRVVERLHSGKAFGEWHSFDGNAFKFRLYKKGTAHIEVHPDMAWRLNAVLASRYPAAIPKAFRRKPIKEKLAREIVLEEDLLSFATLEEDLLSFATLDSLMRATLNKNGTQLAFNSLDSIPETAARALTYLGAVKSDLRTWAFPYDATQALSELQRTGILPERKSHQYYPTPASIAQAVIAFAHLEEAQSILEPEAGQGGIAKFLPVQHTTCVEISALHCKVLEGMGLHPVCTDFLTWQANRTFDRIVMNPPFAKGQAEAHLSKAVTLLAKQGRLVCVLPSSFKGKELVSGYLHEWGPSFHKEFQDTDVSVVLLALHQV